jgi:diacylglycerol kinase family enzyme
MRNVDAAGKKRLGRLAYFRSAVKATQSNAVRMTIRVDGTVWFKGKASIALIGNVGTVAGGLTVFPDASASDGMLEIGVVTASGVLQWVRVLARVARHHPDRSPFVEMTRGKRIRIELGRKLAYELDGGVRGSVKRLKVRVEADAITVCVPTARRRVTVSHRPRTKRAPVTPRPTTLDAATPAGRDSDEHASPQSNF